MDLELFENDDEGYLNWLENNPDGFVVNCHNPPGSDYLRLHHASCSHIRTQERTNWTTNDYMKVCSNSVEALERWAADRTDGGELEPCQICNA